MIPLWDKFTRPVFIWIYYGLSLLTLIIVHILQLLRKKGPSRIPSSLRDKIDDQYLQIHESVINKPGFQSQELPFVSIVVPVFNAENTLEYCLKSLINQSYPSTMLEILIVDNGSTDKSMSIARQFDVKILSCQEQGPGAARNKGVLNAQGEWIAFIDSDCIAHPEWVMNLVSSALSSGTSEINFLGGEIRGVYGANKAMRRFAEETGLMNQADAISSRMLSYPFVITANALVKKAVFLSLEGFDTRLKWGDDVELGWRFHFQGTSPVLSPKAVVWHFHRLSVFGLYSQYFRYGKGEVLATLKWNRRFDPVTITNLLWFKPYEYRLFWKRILQMIVAFFKISILDLKFNFYVICSMLAHTAGRLMMNHKYKTFRFFKLFPEKIHVENKRT